MFETNRFQALVLEEINEYRRAGLPSQHRPGSAFWSNIPFFIPEHCFFTLLYAIETFTQMYVDNTMYLHAFVRLPIPVTSRVRQSIYKIFLANIPWAVFRLVEGVRFRFYFHHNPFVTSIRISQMNVLPFMVRIGSSALFENYSLFEIQLRRTTSVATKKQFGFIETPADPFTLTII